MGGRGQICAGFRYSKFTSLNRSVDIVYHHPARWAGWKIRLRRANFLSLLDFGVSELTEITVFFIGWVAVDSRGNPTCFESEKVQKSCPEAKGWAEKTP